MKRLRKLLAVLLAALLIMPAVFTAFAEEAPEQPGVASTADKLIAFFNYETPSGLRNGDLTYIVDIPEGGSTMYSGEYNGNGQTAFYENRSFMLSIGIWVYGTTIMEDGTEIAWDDWDYPVCPDFYGPLDLADTDITCVRNSHNNSTHISYIDLDDCDWLQLAELSWQTYCTEISAVNCPRLIEFEALNGGYRNITVQPANYEAPVEVTAIGSGMIGLKYNEYTNAGHAIISATEIAPFTGWFVNGAFVSNSTEYIHEGAGRVIACFGGDADGSGDITVADAIVTLRAAMGLAANDGLYADMNDNGTIDVSDAIILLRIAMGVI